MLATFTIIELLIIWGFQKAHSVRPCLKNLRRDNTKKLDEPSKFTLTNYVRQF